MITKSLLVSISLTAMAAMLAIHSPVTYADNNRISADKRRVIEHWTPARMAAAIPRDLVIDERGLGYLRKPDGTLEPYGHSVAPLVTEAPRGKPSGGSDTDPPSVTEMTPDGATIGTSATFSATITDASGIKSVSFVITYPSGATQSFNPAFVGADKWSINLQGFSYGDWKWHVVAKDGAARGGNTTTTDLIEFYVRTDGSSGSGGSGDGTTYITTNAEWAAGGAVQTVAGRIYFEMPSNPKWKRWAGYVCSGSVATDDTTGRSVIITAAHCAYDDANKAFARNVLFIPNQAGTTGAGTDLNCGNDPLGCWVPSFGVVDVNWTTRTFPDNVAWDYAYYVVPDSGAHKTGSVINVSSSLDSAAGSLGISFDSVIVNDGVASATSEDFTHALGYSYSDDPNLMYCAEDMTTEGAANWWLPSCALSGGASGGPWIQPMDTAEGDGPIMSVNSWGYTSSPGMAGPKLVGTSAGCLFDQAKRTDIDPPPSAEGEAGIIVSPSTDCP